MKCSKCGTENVAGSLFCDTCGAAQARVREPKANSPFPVGEPVRLSAPTGEAIRPAQAERLSMLAILSLLFGAFSVFTMTCLGLVFLVFGPFIGIPPALVGIVTGHVALGRIRSSQGQLSGSGAALTGLVLSYLTLLAGLGVTVAWLVLGKLLLGVVAAPGL